LADAEALYPYVEQSAQWLGKREMTLGLMNGVTLRYRLYRRRLAQTMSTALHLSDLVEPLLVGQAIRLPGARLTSAGGAAVRGEYRLLTFGSANVPQEHVVLREGAHVAGYRVPVGHGTSTVLGTLPGGAYATSVYYRLTSEERVGLRRFAVELMKAAGIQRQMVSDLEIETVRRRLPDGSWLLFLLNRLGEQRGEMKLALDGLPGALRVETLYAFKHSSVEPGGPGTLHLTLATDDVLALHVMPA
jgi:hypothetical protein